MADVLCFGEILVDWVSTTAGVELERTETFTKSPGGAPANTAICLARQGIKTAFVGRIAQDKFGLWLRDVLVRDGIDVSGIVEDAKAQTRMAYVVTTDSGDRKLAAFTNIACADARIEPADLKPELFAKASIFHFGSISLIGSPAACATEHAVKLAHDHGMLISYDPNIRISLWPNENECRQRILNTLHWADLVKINEDELQFLTGSCTLEAAQALSEQHKIPLLVITLGARGAMFVHASGTKRVKGFNVKFVEATGAGDGFNAGMIASLLAEVNDQTKRSAYEGSRRRILASLGLKELEIIVKRANAIGALTCTKVGAFAALPTRKATDLFLDEMLLKRSLKR